MIIKRGNINKSILLVISAIFVVNLFGCDGFISRTPENSISSTEFFESEGHVEQSVIGIYAALQDVFDNDWIFTELRSDNTTTMWNDENRGPHPIWIVEEWTMTPSNIQLEPYWNQLYEGVQRSNAVINNIDDAEFSDQSIRDRLEGEAKFLRALFYFRLVRLFGDVPLVLEQVESPGEAFSTIEGREDASVVYDQIINDLGEAIDLLPLENTGRATEGAARSMLAEVHMTNENYDDAIGQLDSVIGMEYELMDNYEDVFDPTFKNNEEIIFSVQYAELSDDRSLGNSRIYDFAPHNSGDEITGDNASNPNGLNLPSRDLVDAFEEGDTRKDASIGFYVDEDNRQHGIAMGDTIPYVKKYASPHSVRGVTDDNWPVYRYAGALLMMAEALNEVNRTDDAYQYINRVRQRAGIGNLTSGLSQSQFRDSVLHERRLELAFENDRWFNLLRTDRAIEAMERHAEVHRGIQTHWQEPAYVIEEYKLKYPIPQREISLNPDLEQNPGW